jgi:hypothetical protein
MELDKALASREKPLVFRRELQYLYARREAIDLLIDSLQSYERYQPKPAQLLRPRKPACA